jgi:signal transduction histidine kinase/ActR/RegA family two-component response regulator
MLQGHYEIALVLVSILVAIFASCTALSLAQRVTRSEGRAVHAWTVAGALAMGSGIWAMHFVGMLAFRLPIALGYDLKITLLSLVLPILVSGVALWRASQPDLRWSQLGVSALLMGLGINAMHYTGMAAMRMEPGITYDPWLFALSVVIAVAASAGALWISFWLRHHIEHAWLVRVGSALTLGGAIVGMHYTAMAAAHFPLGSISGAALRGVSQNALAVLVVSAALGILTIALLASIYDARLEAKSRVLALSQATAEEQQRLLLREREARSQAESMSAMKDEFLTMLSHELRTPLNAIFGWAEMLRRGIKDEATLQRGLETIERNARAQARLIEDLLDMSRLVSGKLLVEVQAVDPAASIEAALETVRPAAIAKHIELTRVLARECCLITGDPGRLQQVMWNLLSNAVKFTPNGGAVRVVLAGDRNEVVIRVSDTGIGIHADFLPHVFERFRQADASTTRRHGGLGLGLSIVKELVELQGGTIEVASGGAGQGASFTLRFPQLATGEAGSGRCASPQPLRAPAPIDLSGTKVLVVDDALDTLELLQRVFDSAGALTLTAAGASYALALIESQRPDVIVSDVGMPDIDGFELLRRARQLGAAGQVPAIALTAFSGLKDNGGSARAGFCAYLAKPVEPALLLSTVAQVLKQRDGERAAVEEGKSTA